MPIRCALSHFRFFLCALGAGLLLLAVPTLAAAATFEVNTTKDGADLPAECGPGGEAPCLTLREAIEGSNMNDAPEADTITFGGLSAGETQIEVEGESLPAITREVNIEGDTAPGATAGVPALEIVAGDLGEGGFTTGLKVHEGTGTRIEGFAIGGFEAGIEVGPAESEGGGESPSDTQICGNYLGVKLDGVTPEPNVTGVEVWATSESERPETTKIGGLGCPGNAISGNSSYGVWDLGLETTIADNRVGYGPEPADLELPNGTSPGEGGAAGIRETELASGAIIGGTAPSGAEANLIWFNHGPGVRVEGSAGEVSIRHDSFLENEGLGIEIVGGTPPAPPVVSAAAEPARQSFKVEGTVTGTVGESVELKFFGSPTCDPSGFGEGQTYLGSAIQPIEAEPTHYEFVLSTEPPADDTSITATSTREAGATSEFSGCAPYVAPQTFTVTTAQDPFPGECTMDVCSLRGAIEAANATPSVDTIEFAEAGTITPQVFRLPPITAPVKIEGASAPGYDGTPLVEIDGTALTGGSGTTGLVVRSEGSGSTISGLAIGHFDYGVLLEGTDNQVCGSYLGVETDGTAQLANEIGIEAAPGSVGDRIGAGCAAPGGGNLISANTAVGIDDHGSETRIADNRIGINANGEPMGNGEFGAGAGIVISPESSGAMIGTIDGGTGNVIAYNQDPGIVVAHSASVAKIRGNSIFENFGRGIEIELEPPTVPTVTGVTVGSGTLTFSGEATAGPSEEGIELDFFASHTCDPSGAGEGQTFLGSESFESFGGATAYETEGLAATVPAGQNYITATSTGSVLGQTTEFSQCFLYVPPAQTFTVTTLEVSFRGECGATCSLRDAIEAANESPNHDTIDFEVPGTIKPHEQDLPELTEPVTIDGTSAPGYAGTPVVTIDGTEALSEGATEGLVVGGSAGGSTIEGLEIANFAEGIVVGANHTLLESDTVAHNEDLGIQVSNEAPATAIRRSEIYDDGGTPIEFKTPNAVPTPEVEAFVPGEDTTTFDVPLEGRPEETYEIDVFADAQCEAGEFGPAEVLLASGPGTTDSAGKATAEPVGRPLGGIDAENFTATATEQATGTTSQIGHCARTQPEAEIESTPPAVSGAAKATFTFSGFAYGQIASYECSLDAGGFKPCASPQEYPGLADGSHTFRVRAVTDEGARDPVPPSYTWTIDTTGPTTSITAAPSMTTESTTAGFEFAAPGATGYECSLDGGAYAPCASPQSFGGLPPGHHTFAVRATGEAGSTGPPTVYQWTVASPPPKAEASTAPPPTEEPTPTNGEKVVVQPEEGKVLIKLPGSKKYVPLEELKEIPVGAVIDATKGKVVLTSTDPDGTEQSADFFGGVFKVKQKEGADLVVLELLDTGACPAPSNGTEAPRPRELARGPARQGHQRQALGQRARQLPHRRQQRLGDGAGNDLAGRRPLQRHHLLQDAPRRGQRA